MFTNHDSLNAAKADKHPTCFVIMPFSDPPGYPKDHFNKIYNQIFKPAIIMAGYTPLRCDEIINGKTIHSNMFQQLDQASLVLCDLTTFNPNVLYELGRRDALEKPTVLVQEEGQDYLFNLREYTVVSYRRSRLYDEVPEDQKRIANAIRKISLENASAEHTRNSDPLPALKLRTKHYQDWSVAKQRADSPSFQIEPTFTTFLGSSAYSQLVDIVISANSIRRYISRGRDSNTMEYAKQKLAELRDTMNAYSSYCNTYDDIYHDAEDLELMLEEYLNI